MKQKTGFLYNSIKWVRISEHKGEKIMKEYKVMEVKKRDAEKVMNDMSAQGWEVVSMTYWNYWKICLLIVFSRDV